jgi:ABC-type transport system substrate-binding protein
VPSNYDLNTFLSGYNQGGPAATGQLDIFEYSARPLAFPDPHTPDFLCREIPFDEFPQGSNWSAICDEELDDLFEQQISQVDFSARQQTFFQISKQMLEKAYFVGLWQDPDLWGIRPRLANVKISGVSPFFNLLEWDLQ